MPFITFFSIPFFPTQLRNPQSKPCLPKQTFDNAALFSSPASFTVITEMCCRHYTLYN